MRKNIRKIGLEGVKFNGPVGYFEEERIFKNDFLLDIYVVFELAPYAKSEDINQTIDYILVYDISFRFFQKETLLIETVAQQILEELKHRFPFLEEIFIRIKKLNPPMKAEIQNSVIELTYQR